MVCAAGGRLRRTGGWLWVQPVVREKGLLAKSVKEEWRVWGQQNAIEKQKVMGTLMNDSGTAHAFAAVATARLGRPQEARQHLATAEEIFRQILQSYPRRTGGRLARHRCARNRFERNAFTR